MTYSLRRVLAVRFSLTMLVALGLITSWALLAFERTLRHQLDVGIAGAAEQSSSLLGAGGHLTRVAQPDDYASFTERLNRFVVVRDSSGQILESNTPLAANLPVDSTAFARALVGDSAWATGRWNDDWIRSAYVRVHRITSPGTSVLQVTSSMQSIAVANRDLLFVMFGIVLLGTLATAFGAFWLARSAVQPVVEVAAQALALPSAIEGKRITAHADVAEYESLIEVLNNLLVRSEGAIAAQRRFIGDVSHELRTPLTALQGQLEVTLRGERSPRDYQLALRAGLEEVEHLARMCDSLLLVTRAENNAIGTDRTATDLGALTRNLLDRRHRSIEEKGLAVDTRFEYHGAAPELDASLCARALEELVDNGIKFSPHGARLAIGTRPADNGVEWWIEDQGPGIPADDLPRLFEPFYRVDPARTRDTGSGLGLTLAASLARLHGATIHAESPSTGGARFAIRFPIPAVSAAA